MATTNEETTVSQWSAIRAARGDDFAWHLLDRLRANGLRTYGSNKATREALVREGNAIALVNSSNYHVFLMEGNPVGESWLDQEPGGLGTHVEAHVVAVVKGARDRYDGHYTGTCGLDDRLYALTASVPHAAEPLARSSHVCRAFVTAAPRPIRCGPCIGAAACPLPAW